MPFDLAATFNGGMDRIANSQLLGGALRNPVASALVLTAIVYAIFYSMRRTKTPSRFAVWAGAAIALFLFMHYQVVDGQARRKYGDAAVRSTMDSILGGSQGRRAPTVVPRGQDAIFVGGAREEPPPPRREPAPPPHSRREPPPHSRREPPPHSRSAPSAPGGAFFDRLEFDPDLVLNVPA